jgi:AAA domain
MWIPSLWRQFMTSVVAYLSLFVALSESQAALDPNISAQLQKTELAMSHALEETQSTPRDFDQYLMDSNPDILDRIKTVHDQSTRSVTFIIGDPGVGKSSLIRALREKINNVQLIELSQLAEHHSDFPDIAEEKDDLVTCSGQHYAYGKLPAIKDNIPNWLPTIFSRLGVSNLTGTIMIDDLDEIDPDSAKRILNEVVTRVRDKSRDLLHLMIFGRPEAFVGFYDQPRKFDVRIIDKLTCNGVKDYFHTDFVMSAVIDLQRKRVIPGIDVGDLSKKLMDFLRRHQELVITMANRAQSVYLIEALANGSTNVDVVKRSIYNALLKRARETHNRPTQGSIQYEVFLQDIARRYASEVEPVTGYFVVTFDDFIPFKDEAGRSAAVKVSDVLDRSGLARLDSVDFSQLKYRFEPFWLHRYLAEMNTVMDNKDQASEVIQQVQDVLRDLWLPKIALFGFGVTFIVILLGSQHVAEKQKVLFRVLLSLAAAGIGASIPGSLSLHLNIPTGSIEAGGACAVFVICLLINPPELLSKGRSKKKI